jgi:hypothetical protein
MIHFCWKRRAFDLQFEDHVGFGSDYPMSPNIAMSVGFFWVNQTKGLTQSTKAYVNVPNLDYFLFRSTHKNVVLNCERCDNHFKVSQHFYTILCLQKGPLIKQKSTKEILFYPKIPDSNELVFRASEHIAATIGNASNSIRVTSKPSFIIVQELLWIEKMENKFIFKIIPECSICKLQSCQKSPMYCFPDRFP